MQLPRLQQRLPSRAEWQESDSDGISEKAAEKTVIIQKGAVNITALFLLCGKQKNEKETQRALRDIHIIFMHTIKLYERIADDSLTATWLISAKIINDRCAKTYYNKISCSDRN